MKMKLLKKMQQLSDANNDINATNNDINATNHALDMLRKVQYGGRTFSKEPQINDYYHPSSDIKKYQRIFIVGAGLAGCVIVAKFII